MTANRSKSDGTRTVLVLAGVVALLALWAVNLPAQESPSSNSGAAPGYGRNQNKSVAHLYFTDKNNLFLIAEERVLSQSGDPVRFGQTIIAALIEGPGQELAPIIPQNTKLRALFITEDGTCYVDFSADIQENHPGGVTTELLTVYSIVNSLILNIAEIGAVKILIEGQESITLAGHIDLQQPLEANMLLIR
jgi:spore germination protein GerM